MPKFVSERGASDPTGTHLYPARSVQVTDEKPKKGHASFRGIAHGRAYCGAEGRDEEVFSPDSPEDTFLGFTGGIDWKGGGKWQTPCADCTSLVESGKLTDPEWIAAFRCWAFDEEEEARV